MSLPLLLIEDEPTLAKNICTFLARHDFDVHVAESGEDGLDLLERVRPAAVILDYNLPGIDGLEVLRRVRVRCPRTKVVMVTGQGSESIAVEAMKAGALDYLTKPVEMARLRQTISRAIEPPRPAAAVSGLAKLVGDSPRMDALKQLLERVIDAEASLADNESPAVLVTGETGTGKELVARALHFDGRRAAKPFIEVNCSGIPANLLEAEIFGFERGAFTDAKEQKIGLIEAADGGTLFLDEIGELDLNAQAKLLKLIEDKQVRRLGSVREKRVDVRIVAATNRDLETLVRAGRFRADLYFRLGIIRIEIPPLRERGRDVVRLAEHFLAVHAARYGKPELAFETGVADALLAHDWPGNVRELRNMIEQCVVLARGNRIGLTDLALKPRAPATSHEEPESLNLARVERELLLRALESSGWNVSQAARVLGVSRDTLRYRIEKFQLKLPS